MTKLYSIRDWDNTYETYETKKLESLRWVPIPNKHDGLGFRRLAMQRDNEKLLAGWLLLVQIASKGRRGTRGKLERDGLPLTVEDLSLMTGFSIATFERCLSFFSDPKQGWLIVGDCRDDSATEASLAATAAGSPEGPLKPPASPASSARCLASPAAEGKEGKEGKDIVRPQASPERSIYDLYPRKVAPREAMKAITKALSITPYEQLRERVTMFSQAVAKWPPEDRQYVPHPATWFNRGSYDDDPTTWQRGKAFLFPPKPAPKPVEPAPANWESKLIQLYPDGLIDPMTGRHRTWQEIPADIRKEIAS